MNLQGMRKGFIEQYIYSFEELEEIKLQQQQRELNMRPWDRDIQELERYYQKTQEQQNIATNYSTSIAKGLHPSLQQMQVDLKSQKE